MNHAITTENAIVNISPETDIITIAAKGEILYRVPINLVRFHPSAVKQLLPTVDWIDVFTSLPECELTELLQEAFPDHPNFDTTLGRELPAFDMGVV